MTAPTHSPATNAMRQPMSRVLRVNNPPTMPLTPAMRPFASNSNTAASPMEIKTITELNGGGTTVTDTTQTLAETVPVQFKVLVSAAGVVTFQHDIAVPGTLAAPSAVGTLTFDTGDPVVPFFDFLNVAAAPDGVIIHSWEAGYQ